MNADTYQDLPDPRWLDWRRIYRDHDELTEKNVSALEMLFHLQKLSNGSAEVDKAIRIAMKAPMCAAPYIHLCEHESNLDAALDLADRAIAAGEAELGCAVEEFTGEFWTASRSVAYMKARAAKASVLERFGRYKDALPELKWLVKANPRDDQGNRYLLIVCLVRLERWDEAEEFLWQYEGLEDTAIAYTNLLMALIRGAPESASVKLLEFAMANNIHVPAVLERPDIFMFVSRDEIEQGSLEEALGYANAIGFAWADHPDALGWLRHHAHRIVAERFPMPTGGHQSK